MKTTYSMARNHMHGTGGTGGVKDTMHGVLDMLPTTFTRILVLVLRLRLPVVDVVGS
jgi:hypothetical protein